MNISSILANKGNNVITADPDSPLGAISRTLADNRIGAIVVLDGGEGEESAKLGDHLSLHPCGRPEMRRTGGVDHEENREFALLDKPFHMRCARASGDIPIDGANVIADLIFAHLIEFHTSPLEDRVVLSSKDIIDQAISSYLDPANFFDQFFG